MCFCAGMSDYIREKCNWVTCAIPKLKAAFEKYFLLGDYYFIKL